MTLAARQVSFAYHRKQTPAVAAVDLELQPGEVLALVGPNGAGKSTLLALLAGWRQPQSGEVLLDGKALHQWPARQRARRVAFLPQQVSPLYDLPVAEVVASGRYPRQGSWAGPDAVDRAAITQALAETGADHLVDRSFSTLSGGERQRVLVASVLAQEPRLLLLDEPTGALDLHHRVRVFSLLRAAADDGRGVAVVTHDLNLAALFADRVVLLADGRVTMAGSVDEVLSQATLEQTYGRELVVVAHPDGLHPAVLPAWDRGQMTGDPASGGSP